MVSPLDAIQIAIWLNDFMTPQLSSGEIPDFVKNENKNENKDNIINTPDVNVTNNFFTYNTTNNIYSSPKLFYPVNVTNIVPTDNDILPKMPKRLLPDTIPPASPTDPPNKPFLSLQESFATKQFGKLLFSPVSDIQEQVTIIDTDKYLEKYENETKLAGQEHQKWLEYSLFNKSDQNFIPTWDKSCALINSFNNKLSIQSGIKNIEYFKQFYAESSKMVLKFNITGLIPKEYTFNIQKISPQELTIDEQNIETIGLTVINNRLGTFLLPFELPTYLLNIQSNEPSIENNELTKINSVMELIKWCILNFDALIGEFPIKLEIDDINPLNDNSNEKTKIKIPNIAECLAELYGLATLASQNSNINLALTTNLIPEILGIKNVSIVNQDFIKAISSFLGFKQGTRKIEFQTNFNPDKPKNWDELITPNRKVYTLGVENKSQDTILEYLINLMYVAGLQKNILLTKNKDIENNELIKELFKASIQKGIDENTNPNDPNLTDGDKKWIEFLKHINKENTSFNVTNGKKTPFTPKVDKHNKI